jgi:putative SbcD/Mre11-related phosphoesterase
MSSRTANTSKNTGKDQVVLGEPVHNEPAFIIKGHGGVRGKDNVLVLADLHYGIEHSLELAGAHVPSQTERITQRIKELCSKNKISELILLGDVKHTIPGASRQEWYELPEVFRNLSRSVARIEIIPGNHDGGIRNLISSDMDNIHVHPNSGAVLHGLGFFHGQTWPSRLVMQTQQVLMAHNHPHVLFIDRLGGRASYSCWVRGRLDRERAAERYENSDPELIIMPAFNDLGSGTPVNVKKPEFLGPILKNGYLDVDNTDIHLLDGTALGRLSDLIELSGKEFERVRPKRAIQKRR